MADPTISITDLRIEDQAVVFTIEFTGAPELEGQSYLSIYDASTPSKSEDELYRAPLSDVQQHTGSGLEFEAQAGALTVVPES
jgi:hypothetical protein